MEHKGTKRIETQRLILRRFEKDDAEASFRNWTGDAAVTKFLRWPTHGSVSTTERVLGGWLELYARRDFYQWAIVPRDLGEPVGTISVVEKNEELGSVCIGYCIGSRWWHLGYTSEAFSAIIPFLFDEVKVNRIESWHDPENPNSGRVMLKCGLRYEGTLKQADISNRGIVDKSVYCLLRSDYLAAKKKQRR